MTEKEALESLKYEVYEEGHCSYIEEELDIAIKALEKQIPKKVVNRAKRNDVLVANCPACRCVVLSRPYCARCGQRLDWSEVE